MWAHAPLTNSVELMQLTLSLFNCHLYATIIPVLRSFVILTPPSKAPRSLKTQIILYDVSSNQFPLFSPEHVGVTIALSI